MGLNGRFAPPGDKSISHRIALMSLLAKGECRVKGFSPCQDCASTLGAVAALGGRVEQRDGEVIIEGPTAWPAQAALDCGNSGTTMRLISGVLAGRPGRFTLDGDASLRRRPMRRVAEPLGLMGARVETTGGKPPLTIQGGELAGRVFDLAVASAQLKSALLLAGVQASGETKVMEPHPTRDHTERLLARCGADIAQADDGGWVVRRSALELPAQWEVPGDASSAAFFLCAAAILPGSQVTATGMSLNPGRIGFLTVLERMGAALTVEMQGEDPEPWGRVTARHSPGLAGCEVTAAEFPLLVDEVPILALVATQAQGTTIFRQAGELRVKESDRLAAITSGLGAMGAHMEVTGDDLYVHGPTALSPASGLDAFGDHRIAMTLELAGLATGQPVEIAGRECAAISYPGFLADLERLKS